MKGSKGRSPVTLQCRGVPDTVRRALSAFHGLSGRGAFPDSPIFHVEKPRLPGMVPRELLEASALDRPSCPSGRPRLGWPQAPGSSCR